MHLASFAEAAEKRYDKGEFWWELRACDYYDEFEKPKLMLPDISLRGNFCYDTDNSYCANTAYIIPMDDKFLLGLLNSQLITFIYKQFSSTYRGGYLRFIYQYLEQIPIRAINFADKTEKAMHDKMAALVDGMLEAKKHSQAARTDRDKIFYADRCAALDRQIDKLVFDLYQLTPDEIKIVESAA